ncbi:conserved Plasmodium protein, unknown function [Plasmodium gallinaceum]|uniref:Uncharacterized protein n=1 Tax=Plasmodium gallinaceum TaxID=5849 RepID=A0A1J1GY60_PLAGA|nr:conserved Plasmodium protein, unknown function [Plasmodium gallinaceum]CRG95944.1 conserved Plasmodium protein, unknown function [Plasmodium gallinaceum]
MLKTNGILLKKWCNIKKKKKRNKKKKKIKKLLKRKYLNGENFINKLCAINKMTLTHNVSRFVNYDLKENAKGNSNILTSVRKKMRNYSNTNKRLNNNDININLSHNGKENMKLKIMLKRKLNLNNTLNKDYNEKNFFSDSTSASSKGFYEFANENNSHIFRRRKKDINEKQENFEYINKINSIRSVELYSLFTFFCTKLKVKEKSDSENKNILNKLQLSKNALSKQKHNQKFSKQTNNKNIPKNKKETKNDIKCQPNKDPSNKNVKNINNISEINNNNNDNIEKENDIHLMNNDQNIILNTPLEKEEKNFNFDEQYILNSNQYLGEIEKDEYNSEGEKKEKVYFTDRCILNKNTKGNSIMNKFNTSLNNNKNIENMNNNEKMSNKLSSNNNEMNTYNKSNEGKRIANLREIIDLDDENIPKKEMVAYMKADNQMGSSAQNNEIINLPKDTQMNYKIQDMQMSYPLQDMQMNYPMQNMQMNYPMQNMQMNYPTHDIQMNYPMQDLQMNYPTQDMQMKHPMPNAQVDYSMHDIKMENQLNNPMNNSMKSNNLPFTFPIMNGNDYSMNSNTMNNYIKLPNDNCNKMLVNGEYVDKKFNLNNKNLITYNNEKVKCDEDFTLNYIIQKYDDDDKFFCNNNLTNDNRNNELRKYTEGMNKIVEQMYFYDNFHDEYKICDEKVNSSNDSYNIIDTSLNLNVIDENVKNENENKENKKVISALELRINELEKNIEELMNKNKQNIQELENEKKKKKKSDISNNEKTESNNIIKKLKKEIEQIKNVIHKKKKKNNNNNKSFKIEKYKEEKKEDDKLVKDPNEEENNNFNLDNIINHENLNNLKNEILDNVYYYIYESYDQKDYEILENLAKKHETIGKKVNYNVNLPKYNFNHKRTSSAWFLNPAYENYMLEEKKKKEDSSKIEKVEFLFNEDKIDENSKKADENNLEYVSEIRDSDFSYETFISEKKKKLKRSKMDLIKIKNSMIHKNGKTISLEQNILIKKNNNVIESVSKKEEKKDNSKKEEIDLYENDIFGIINNYVQDKSLFDLFHSTSYNEKVENKKIEDKKDDISICKEIEKKKKEKELLDLEIENKKKKKELEELELQLIENKKKKIEANILIQEIEKETKLKKVKTEEFINKDVVYTCYIDKENNNNLIRKDENTQDLKNDEDIKEDYIKNEEEKDINNYEENKCITNKDEKNIKDVEENKYITNEEDKNIKDVEEKGHIQNRKEKDKDDMLPPFQQKETDDYFNDYCKMKKKEKKKNNWALYGRPIVKREKKNIILKKLSTSKSDNGFNDYTFFAEKFFEVITGYRSEPDNLSDYDTKSNIKEPITDESNKKDHLSQLNGKKIVNLNKKMKQNIYENDIFCRLGRPKYEKKKKNNNYYKRKSTIHNSILKKNSTNKKKKLLKRSVSKNHFSKFDIAHTGIVEKAKLKLKEKLISDEKNLNNSVNIEKNQNDNIVNDLIDNFKKYNIINNENNQNFDLKYKRKLIYEALDTNDFTNERGLNENDEIRKEDLEKNYIENISFHEHLDINNDNNQKKKIGDTKKNISMKKQDKIERLEELQEKEASKLEEMRKREEAKKLEEMRKQEEARKLEEMKKREEAKKLEEIRRQEEAKKLEEIIKQEEAKKLEEMRRQEEAKKLEEMRKQEEAKKLEEMKKREEAKKLEEMKKREEAKKLEEMKKQEEGLVEINKQEEKNSLEKTKRQEKDKLLDEMREGEEEKLEKKKKGIFGDFFKQFYKKGPLSNYLSDDKDKCQYLMNNDENKPIKGMDAIFSNVLEKNSEKDRNDEMPNSFNSKNNLNIGKEIEDENAKFNDKELDDKDDIDNKKEKMQNLNNLELNNYNVFDQMENQRKKNFRERMSKNKNEPNRILKNKNNSNKVGNKSLLNNSYRNNSIIISNFINKKKDEDKLKEDKLKEEKMKEAKLKEEKMKEDKLKEEKMKEDKLKEEKLKEEKAKEEKLKEEKLKEEKAKEEKLKEEKAKEEKKKKLLKMRNKNLKYNSLHEEHLKDLIEKNMTNNENFLPVDNELYDEEKDDIFETDTESSFLKIDDNDYINSNSLKTHIYDESNNKKRNDDNKKLREYFKNNYKSSNLENGSLYPRNLKYSGELSHNNSYNILKNAEIEDEVLNDELKFFDIINESRNITDEILNHRNINISYSDNFSKNYEDIYFDFEKSKLDSEENNSFDLNSYNLYEDLSNNSIGTKKNSNSFSSLKSSYYKEGDPFTNYSFEKMNRDEYIYKKDSPNNEKKNDEILTNIMNNLHGLNKKIKSIEMNYNFEKHEKDKLDINTNDFENDKQYSYFNYQNKNKYSENTTNKYEYLHSSYYYR